MLWQSIKKKLLTDRIFSVQRFWIFLQIRERLNHFWKLSTMLTWFCKWGPNIFQTLYLHWHFERVATKIYNSVAALPEVFFYSIFRRGKFLTNFNTQVYSIQKRMLCFQLEIKIKCVIVDKIMKFNFEFTDFYIFLFQYHEFKPFANTFQTFSKYLINPV